MESCRHPALAQLVHAIGLNDVCDSLRLASGLLVGLRGATPPSRNNLFQANRQRDAALAEKLFWAVLEHLRGLPAGFAGGRRGRGLARALLMEPRVLLADEPTGNLDSEASAQVVNLFREIGERHRTTIVMVTHNREVANAAHQVVTMRDGRVVS